MIHAIGFVHTRFDEQEFSHCAYTTKVVRWVEMLGAVGEQITVYWGGDQPVNTAGVHDFVSLMPPAEQAQYFGEDLPASILLLDWNPFMPHWKALNHRAAAALYARLQPEDLVCVLSGSNHNDLIGEFDYAKFLEPWVGYVGISQLSYAKAYESSAWRHHMAGWHHIDDGQPLDTVIPNYYRPDDFTVGDDGGYLLYVGRMIKRKGVEDMVAIARRVGLPLIIAGQGAQWNGEHQLVCDDNTVLDTKGLNVEYRGVVKPDERRELYTHASATLVPTLYWEPFGGVFAEAMLSGVLPVCRDWGAFVEYVPDPLRFSTVDQAAECVSYAIDHRGPHVRDEALTQFSTDACAKRFVEWLGRIRG